MSALPEFLLTDDAGEDHSFTGSRRSIICFVKEDCPTCNEVMPVLEALYQSFGGVVDFFVAGQTVEGNRLLQEKHAPSFTVLDDSRLKVSFAFDIDTVPTLSSERIDRSADWPSAAMTTSVFIVTRSSLSNFVR